MALIFRSTLEKKRVPQSFFGYLMVPAQYVLLKSRRETVCFTFLLYIESLRFLHRDEELKNAGELELNSCTGIEDMSEQEHENSITGSELGI